MNITNAAAASMYATQNYATESKTSVKEKSESGRTTTATDTYTSSTEGMEALENSKKSYDLAKVMAIHKKGFTEIPTREESDYYWDARRNDPALDARLYAEDKAKALQEIGQIQTLLMKVSSGQELTPEEKELVKNDPMLQAEVEKRRIEKESMSTT